MNSKYTINGKYNGIMIILLKITNKSIYTYMETKENSDNDKWVFFKKPKMP